MILKPVIIIGVIVACSIFSLAVGLSSDNIFSNQNGSEIQKEELKVELEQEDSIPKTLQKSSENISYDFDSVTTINIEIYGDTFDFSAKQFQPFELTLSDGKFKISESAIGTNLGDFLMSYGLSLDDKCLVFVYENKSYCTTKSDTLSYSINDNPVSNIAYYKINQGQEIEIKFKNKMWTDEDYVIFNKNLEKESKIQVERVVDAENHTYSDEISSVSTIEVEIFGDEFDFAAEKYGLFALEYTYPELRGNHKFTIPEYAIGNSIGNFFNSYALSLDDQCLEFIYEDRSFCSNDSFMLTYFINGNPVSNIAYYEIDHGQEIEIKFNADYSNKSLEKELKIQKDKVDGAQKRAIDESSNNNGIEQNKPFSNVENAV